jgi:hypothetical protein
LVFSSFEGNLFRGFPEADDRQIQTFVCRLRQDIEVKGSTYEAKSINIEIFAALST